MIDEWKCRTMKCVVVSKNESLIIVLIVIGVHHFDEGIIGAVEKFTKVQ